ncbi:MAG: hypothetical protein ACOC9R_01725 [bacterium]
MPTTEQLEITTAGWGDKYTVKLEGRIIGYVQRWPSISGRSVRFQPLSRNLLPIGGDGRRYRTRRDAAADVLAAHRRAQR